MFNYNTTSKQQNDIYFHLPCIIISVVTRTLCTNFTLLMLILCNKNANYKVYPTRNTLHVTFMYHAIIIDLHALHNMHVVMLMYMNVSCNMHGFGTFSREFVKRGIRNNGIAE